MVHTILAFPGLWTDTGS